jgi:hypothetical protein
MRMLWTSAWVVGTMLAALAAGAQTQGGCTFTDDAGKSVFWPKCKDPGKQDPAKTDTSKQDPKADGSAKTPAATTPEPTQSTPDSPKSFPFPGETPAAQTPANSTSQQPGENKGATQTPDGPKRFPFPGEDSAAPKPAAGQGGTPASGDGLKDSGSSGSSSSSSDDADSSSSSSDNGNAGAMDGDNDAAAKAAAARHRKRLNPTVKEHSANDREAEDLTVAGFYQNDGNYRGAYLRAKDAVTLASDDADAHLALAEAARKLGKLDEAEVHYKKALTLDPVPKTKKAAEKALKEMSGGE